MTLSKKPKKLKSSVSSSSSEGLLPELARGTAIVSECNRYRYLLTRQLNSSSNIATFIMLNPSTADASVDDATIRKCKGFAKLLGCGNLQVVNLFAFRARHPKEMKLANDPVGPDNEIYIKKAVEHSNLVVCGWGTHGSYLDQGSIMLRWLKELNVVPMCYGLTHGGHPRHPLFVSYTAKLVSFGEASENLAV